MAITDEQLEEFEALTFTWDPRDNAITALVAEVRRLQAEQQAERHVITNALARLDETKSRGAMTTNEYLAAYQGVVAEIRRGLEETRRGMDV